MDNQHSLLSRRLIIAGTTLVVSAVILYGFQTWLSAVDVHEHRSLASNMLQTSTISRVTLPEWEPPSMALAWTALAGGFAVIVMGIGIGARPSGLIKGQHVDHFD